MNIETARREIIEMYDKEWMPALVEVGQHSHAETLKRILSEQLVRDGDVYSLRDYMSAATGQRDYV